MHRNLVFAVIDGLDLIFNEGEYADKVVQKVLKIDKRWGSRDRGFIAQTIYEMVRYKRLIQRLLIFAHLIEGKTYFACGPFGLF